MTDKGPQDPNDTDFNRPWEDEEETAEIVPLPGIGGSAGEEEGDVFSLADEFASTDPEGTGDEAHDADDPDQSKPPTAIDDFTSDDYLTATTQDYQGLAEDVSRAAEEKWEQQAVAATLPGVESGLVGFEDVGGAATESEESYEAVEQAASSDLTMRVASGLVIFGLFLGSLVLGGWWFSAFVILVMVVAVGELYANLRTRDYRPLALFGLIGVVLIGIGAHNWGPTAIAGWAAIVTAATVLFFSITPRHNPLENASVTVMGMVWVRMLSFAILIAAGPHPVAYIVFFVLLIALNDTGAYFVGRSIGRRKLAPNISPAKTVEGLIGGLIVGAIAASVMVTFPAWETIGLANGLVTAAVIGVFSPLGDLCESMVKRSIGVKDMGSVLPGHGGMLDRVDGFLFAVPAVYILFRAFGLL